MNSSTRPVEHRARRYDLVNYDMQSFATKRLTTAGEAEESYMEENLILAPECPNITMDRK